MLHYDLDEARPPLRRLVDILSQQVALVRQAVNGLSDLRHTDGLPRR